MTSPSQPAPEPIRPRPRPGRVALLVLWSVAAACGGNDEPAGPDPAVVQARDRAAEFGLWEKDGWVDARKALQPVADREDAPAEDLLRIACAILGTGAVEEAEPYVERAAKLAPESPVLHWVRFRIARIRYKNEEALRELREVRRLAPGDLPSRLALGMVLSDLAMDEGSEARSEEALRELRAFVDLPPETTGAWRVTALFRLSSLLGRLGHDEEAKEAFDAYQRYQDQGVESPGEPEHQPGTLGAIPPAEPRSFTIEPPPVPASVELEALAGTEGLRGVRLVRLGPDPERDPEPGGPAGEEVWAWDPEPPSLVGWGAEGVSVRSWQGAGYGAPRSLATLDVLDLVPFDRGNKSTEPTSFRWRREGDPGIDFLLATPEGSGFVLRLLEEVAGQWTLHEPFFRGAGQPIGGARLVPVDLDHEGDLDLVVATAAGVHVLRNDDFGENADGMSDVTGELPLPSGPFRPVAEDVDRDSDVDLFLVPDGGGAPAWLSSERGWRFVDASGEVPRTSGPLVTLADFDGTGFVDFAELGATLRVHVRGPAGAPQGVLEWKVPSPGSGLPVACDWDLDGLCDLLWPTEGGGVAGVLAPGFAEGGVPFTLAPGRGTGGPYQLLVADVDGDHDQDLLVRDGNGVRLGLGSAGKGLALELRGYKDNARGVGAVVRTREGLRARRIYWRGEPVLLSVGAAGDALDMLRVEWPNGVEQSTFDLAGGRSLVVWQRPGLVGSCPFLYVWNGETYEFVSDVLGITPLGLPMAPGAMVPPDHDEYVLVAGERLVPRDGAFEIQLTEELREVTYLDRVRLDVVDHPAGTEVFPNERFSFPPFPEHHVHTVQDPLAPLEARDQEGRDWTAELSADDVRFAVPFEARSGQYQGLATPHALTLTFDGERVRAAERLRLLMNGWFFWTDASVNVAAARHRSIEFVPPLLEVPDGRGGWRPAGPPLGFPAGKLKTMVADVTDLVERDDPRLRIRSTLRLYWDSIRLAVDPDDAPLAVTRLEPASAELWERGFSQPLPLQGEHHLEWFEWNRLAAEPRWNQHPGRYTRFGDVLELLGAIDDRFVIMGSGDALAVRFDARGLPPLREGWRRDFLVFLDGWAKDRDPNTLEALHVEPLPFHGMSGYPYGPGERFPDDAAHRTWRERWNTRPAKRWIPPVLPPTLFSATPHEGP